MICYVYDFEYGYFNFEMFMVEKFIVNYGDVMNMFWFDDWYYVWWYEFMGVVIGYVEENGYVFVMGNFLCDLYQYNIVICDFLKYMCL